MSSAARTRRPVSSPAQPATRSGSATLSKAFLSKRSLWSWNTKPMRRRSTASAVSPSAPRLCPWTTTVPLEARSIPAASLRSVDLPAPECPVTATISPAAISTVTPRSASWPPE